MALPCPVAVFDLGGVLIDWNPRHLYRKLFEQEAETFPMARRRFEFLRWFRAIFLSGEVRLVKPDPRIFERFCETFALRPEQIVYIDDLRHNVEAARTIGMHGIRFRDAASLRQELVQFGLLR